MPPLTFIWKFITMTNFATFCLNIKLHPIFKLYVTVTYTEKVKTEQVRHFVTLVLGKNARLMWSISDKVIHDSLEVESICPVLVDM